MPTACSIGVILFDFGGVIAEEGFREGLRAVAKKNHLDEETFIETAHDIIYSSGYIHGKAPESAFWSSLKARTGISGDDDDLRHECLSRFVIRDWMLALVRKIKDHGIRTDILSDQTDWLDVLNQRDDFFRYFDHVFNSYHMGNGKRDPDHFDAVVRTLGVPAQDVLFIDDSLGNCQRAEQRGLKVIQYVGREDFLNRIKQYCPFITADE